MTDGKCPSNCPNAHSIAYWMEALDVKRRTINRWMYPSERGKPRLAFTSKGGSPMISHPQMKEYFVAISRYRERQRLARMSICPKKSQTVLVKSR
jgi:hypothetical protein